MESTERQFSMRFSNKETRKRAIQRHINPDFDKLGKSDFGSPVLKRRQNIESNFIT